MKLKASLEIHTAILKQVPNRSKTHPLLTIHHGHVSNYVKKVKEDGDVVAMSQGPKCLKGEDWDSGWQTVVWHGITRGSPNKKTFIQTMPDSGLNLWTEAL